MENVPYAILYDTSLVACITVFHYSREVPHLKLATKQKEKPKGFLLDVLDTELFPANIGD